MEPISTSAQLLASSPRTRLRDCAVQEHDSRECNGQLDRCEFMVCWLTCALTQTLGTKRTQESALAPLRYAPSFLFVPPSIAAYNSNLCKDDFLFLHVLITRCSCGVVGLSMGSAFLCRRSSNPGRTNSTDWPEFVVVPVPLLPPPPPLVQLSHLPLHLHLPHLHRVLCRWCPPRSPPPVQGSAVPLVRLEVLVQLECPMGSPWSRGSLSASYYNPHTYEYRQHEYLPSTCDAQVVRMGVPGGEGLGEPCRCRMPSHISPLAR